VPSAISYGNLAGTLVGCELPEFPEREVLCEEFETYWGLGAFWDQDFKRHAVFSASSLVENSTRKKKKKEKDESYL